MAVNAGTVYSQIVLDNKQYMRGMQAAQLQLKAFEEQINRSSQKFASSMANMDKQYKLWELNANSISKALFGKGKQAELTKQKMNLLEKEIMQTNKVLDEAKKKYGESSDEVQQLETRLLDLKVQHAELNKEMEKFSFPNRLKDVSNQMESFGRAMTMKVTLPIVGVGAAAVKTTAQFDDQMSRVKAISGATGENFDKLRKQATDLGRDTRFSASEAAEGMTNLAMAGFKVDEIYDAMPGMLSLASSGALDLGQASSITSNTLRAFGIEAKNASHIADVLAYAASNANTDVQGVGEAMTYIAPVAKNLGWSLEGTSAAIMALADAGIYGSRAGSVFSTSLGRLAKPTKESEKLMKELKLEFFDAEGAMKPLPEIVQELEKGLANMTPQQKSAALSTLFGAEAYKHWAILMDKGSDSLAKMTVELEKSDGFAQKTSSTMEDNVAGAFRSLKSAIEGAIIAIGDALVPTIKKLAENLTIITRNFAALNPTTQQTIVRIFALIAAIGPLILLGSKLLKGISNLMLFVKGVVGLLGGPLTLAIIGIASLAIVLIKYWEPISEFFKGLWSGVKDVTSATWQGIKAIITTVSNAIKSFISMVWNSIKNLISSVWNVIYNITNTVWTAIKTVITTIINSIKNTITNVFNGIKDVITTIWGNIKSVTSNLWDSIKSVITTIINAISSTISNVFNSIKLTVTNIWGGIKNITSRTWNGIKDVMIRPVNAAKDAIKRALDSIHGFFARLRLPEIKIPKPKLPHFRVTGKFSLSPPQVPKFGVDWYAKGAIFKKPTIFATPYGIKGIAEAGAEAVLPIEKLSDIMANTIRKTADKEDKGYKTEINFYGNYSFQDKDDIDYFMNEAANLVQRRRG